MRRLIGFPVVGLLLGTVVAAWVLVLSNRAAATDLPEITTHMSLFSQPAIPDSMLPSSVLASEQTVPSESSYGSAIANETRRPATGVGTNSAKVYVYPTTGGAVCVVITDATQMDTCVPSFTTATGEVEFAAYHGDGTPWTVVGLASDSVTQVRVVEGSNTYTAALQNNAFTWQSTQGTPGATVTSLIVTLAGGSTVTRTVGQQ
jgi:hypothetical protein